jgi:hypothetical protein
VLEVLAKFDVDPPKEKSFYRKLELFWTIATNYNAQYRAV